jgi:hypothetical protein
MKDSIVRIYVTLLDVDPAIAPRGSAPKSFLRERLKPKAETAAARFTKARPDRDTPGGFF